ncbi:Os12g0230233 [Oryza sativa Japonica Group]|uniref:Os12g0230233 protein n=1 Tax=Oryza sativa subsp. japonica TaxID=39947 RepID=A0A0P0Y8A0_ORYSJ|nr:Os12g0230233 [Oryza sativa Japonica Group]
MHSSSPFRLTSLTQTPRSLSSHPTEHTSKYVVDRLLVTSWGEGFFQLFDLYVPAAVLVEEAEHLRKVLIATDFLQVNGYCHKLLAIQYAISIYELTASMSISTSVSWMLCPITCSPFLSSSSVKCPFFLVSNILNSSLIASSSSVGKYSATTLPTISLLLELVHNSELLQPGPDCFSQRNVGSCTCILYPRMLFILEPSTEYMGLDQASSLQDPWHYLTPLAKALFGSRYVTG